MLHYSFICATPLADHTPATPNIVPGAAFILSVIAPALPLYESLFGVAYPHPKLDTLVAS